MSLSSFVGMESIAPTAGAVVVIDVLRAFSLAPLALERGAKKIILVRTLEHALELKRENPGAIAVTDGPPRDGFELTNSPAALSNVDISGRILIQRTKAGTQAAVAVGDCRALLCASFVCASATAAALRSESEGVTYVISGDGGSAAEDLACAKFIDALIHEPNADPAPYLQDARESRAADELREGMRLGYKGIHPDDIDVCLSVDRVGFACVASRESYGVVLEASR